MSKLVRFDEDHFGYLVDQDISQGRAMVLRELFAERWPGKQLIVVSADEFIDLTGQYELIRIAELNPVGSGASS